MLRNFLILVSFSLFTLIPIVSLKVLLNISYCILRAMYNLFWERKKRHPRSLSIPSRQIGRRQAHRSVALFEKLETDDQDATRLSRRATQKKKHSTNEASFLITTFVVGVEVTFLIRVTPVSLTN